MGFWGGIDAPELCARLSDVPASFWLAQEDQCRSVVDREVSAFVVGAEAVAAAIAAALLLRFAWHRAVVEPAMCRTAATFAAALSVGPPSANPPPACYAMPLRGPRGSPSSPRMRWVAMCADYATADYAEG